MHRAGGIGIFPFLGDVARSIVSPDKGLAGLLIILADKLVLTVVPIPGGVRPVADGSDITVIVIGVGIAPSSQNPEGGIPPSGENE